MSPRGDPDSVERRAHLASRDHGSPEAEVISGSAGLDVLPLRLSVARGRLGVELSRPLALGPVVCEQLDLALVGVSYPVDLSKGVKQFKSRRSELRAATLSFDLMAIASLWAACLDEVWGEPTQVRLAVSTHSDTTSTRSATREQSANENGRAESLAVCIHSPSGALAFDLVVASGPEPRLLIDNPRSLGPLPFLRRSALQAAFLVVDAGLSVVARADVMKRVGRSVVVAGLARTVCLGLLPQFGFRMPQVGRHVISGLAANAGHLTCVIEQQSEPFVAGFRALQLASTAGFLQGADDLLADGEVDQARLQYLQALDIASAHVGILLEVVDIDLAHEGRAISAVTLLEEARALHGGAAQNSRAPLLFGRAMLEMGHVAEGHAAWSDALEKETDPVFFARLCCELAGQTADLGAARRFLDRGVAKAPLAQYVRLDRLKLCLKQDDLDGALRDAEQLEAGLTAMAARAQLLGQLARLFRSWGHEDEAISFLRRSLFLVPENISIMVELGEVLYQTHQRLRAAEVLSAALSLIQADPNEHKMDLAQRRECVELGQQCNFILAQILFEEDPHSSEVLLHLGAVPTRSARGGEARLQEIEVFHLRKQRKERDFAVSRILEAVQLGWIDGKEIALRLQFILSSFDPPVDKHLAESVDQLLVHS